MVESLFTTAIEGLGGQRGGATSEAYETLAQAYAEPHRRYHTLRHIEGVLETYLWLAEGLTTEESAQVVLALCLHDAVYDPRARDNEARSAAFARTLLAPLGIDEADIREIERLVLVTRDHAADEPLGALVSDSDLAILQSAPADYQRYAAQIRQEYAWVPDDAYRAGRIQVLEGLTQRRLYVSPLLDEAAAKANMAREIASLTV